MFRFTQSIVVLVLMMLRVGIPLLLTMSVGAVVSGIDFRRKRVLQEEMAVVTAGAAPSVSAAQRKPCWLCKNCSEKDYIKCPAYANTSVPCWVARLGGQGRIPSICANCELFEMCFGRS